MMADTGPITIAPLSDRLSCSGCDPAGMRIPTPIAASPFHDSHISLVFGAEMVRATRFGDLGTNRVAVVPTVRVSCSGVDSLPACHASFILRYLPGSHSHSNMPIAAVPVATLADHPS